jgi:DNA-directed RNA polymerase specialized sigma24 family protein
MESGTKNLTAGEFWQRDIFPTLRVLRSQWNLSPENFDTFLAWLDSDRDEAGKEYELIRRRLIKIFASRGCRWPEDLADETINRVIFKIGEISKGYCGDPGRYCGGVARHVFQEYARRYPPVPAVPETVPPATRERELQCLEGCLDGIPENLRTIILRYYEGEKRARIRNRERLARDMSTEINALRIRVCRIRSVLKQCVSDCLARADARNE